MTDEQALADLETLIATQQPAAQPWQPVTDYSFDARKQIEGVHPELILDTFRVRRILDAVCGPDAHLVRLLRDARKPNVYTVDGCDKQKARKYANWFLQADLSGDVDSDRDYGRCLGDLCLDTPYELVICREVLEHLTLKQIRKAVTNLCALSSRFVYVTTRFCKAPQHLLSVDTSDDLDPTHISLLNQSFLRLLFVLEGFRRRADLEAKMDHKGYNRVLVYERAA